MRHFFDSGLVALISRTGKNTVHLSITNEVETGGRKRRRAKSLNQLKYKLSTISELTLFTENLILNRNQTYVVSMSSSSQTSNSFISNVQMHAAGIMTIFLHRCDP